MAAAFAGTGSGSSGDHFTATSNIYDTGFATVSVTAERPDYIAQGNALSFSYDVYVNGAPYSNGSGTIGATSDSGVSNWDNSSSFFYRPINAGDRISIENFKFTNLTAQNYVLKIQDQNGNDLSSKLSRPANWVVSGTTAGDKWIQFASGIYTNTDTFAVTKVENATYTGTLPTGVAVSTHANVAGLKADTTGYVVITVDTSNLTDYAGPWSITTATGTANPEVALSNYGIAGETAVLDITITSASVANDTNYDLSNISVQLTGTPAAYKYNVSIDGMGSVELTSATSNTLSGTIKVNKDIEITKDMVTVSVAEKKMSVTGGSWNGNKLTLTFSENVGTAVVGNFTWAVNGAGNSCSTNPVDITVTGKTVTLSFSGDDLAAGNTITTTASAIGGPTAANTAASQTITLNANGSISIA